MVGLFSRFSASRSTGHHRRSQSAIGDRGALPPNAEVAGATAAATTAAHGIEIAIEFKPVEHPMEPLDNDRPIKCPLPEPSVLNDGRIWKERFSASSRGSNDMSAANEVAPTTSEVPAPKPPRSSNSNRLILPSISMPEHNLVNLLEECNAANASGI